MNRLLRIKLIVVLLATVTATRALVVIGGPGTATGSIRVGPFTDPDPSGVDVRAGNELVLTEPGTYSALKWDMGGELRLAVAGDYFVVARAGSITFGPVSAIRGPDVGTARVTFLHDGEFVTAATVGSGVTVYNGIKPPTEQPPLLNFSTRLTLAAGQRVTSGFVLGGTESRRVLVRAVGPSLANFGIQNPLATPTLAVFRHGADVPLLVPLAPFLANAAAATVGAFPLPLGGRDMASVTTLAPGPYTLEVSGGAGEVLVEIYLLP